MTGRRTRTRKNTKSTAETIKDNGSASSNDEINQQQTHESSSELPRDVLELAISKLSLRDNIRASAVCRRWKTLATSVRRADKPPLLMFLKSVKNMLHELYDPLQRKSYWLELPELQGSRFCYAKEGWLLLYKPSSRTMFFYYPYTRETIDLPFMELGQHEMVAFSSAPTSSSCIVFTIKAIGYGSAVIAISTCRPGASQWTTGNYPNRMTYLDSLCIKIVSCNGIFYCLSDICLVGIHSLDENGTWSFNAIRRPSCPWDMFDEARLKDKFVAEHNGEIFLVYTCSFEDPIIYKLDLTNKAWVEVKSLGGMSLFTSHGSSVARTDLLHGSMRNSVYFAKVRYCGRRCFLYSLEDCRYYPTNKMCDWGKEAEYKCWIDPP